MIREKLYSCRYQSKTTLDTWLYERKNEIFFWSKSGNFPSRTHSGLITTNYLCTQLTSELSRLISNFRTMHQMGFNSPNCDDYSTSYVALNGQAHPFHLCQLTLNLNEEEKDDVGHCDSEILTYLLFILSFLFLFLL